MKYIPVVENLSDLLSLEVKAVYHEDEFTSYETVSPFVYKNEVLDLYHKSEKEASLWIDFKHFNFKSTERFIKINDYIYKLKGDAK